MLFIMNSTKVQTLSAHYIQAEQFLGSVYNYISNIGLSDQVFILMNT